MGIQYIEIETNSLTSDIRTMQDEVGEAERQTNQMFEAMAELDQMWDGPANAAFNRQFQIDYERMKSMCSEVRHLISCMEYARDQYDQCEDEVYRAVAAIRLEGGT